MHRTILFLLTVGLLDIGPPTLRADDTLFTTQVAPLLERNCLACHNAQKSKGDFSLASAKAARAGGESGEVIVPGKPDESVLIEYVSGKKPEMPQDAAPLKKEEVALLRRWIAEGAHWPADVSLKDTSLADLDWWSLKPLMKPAPPKMNMADARWARTPIDAFLVAKMRSKGLSPSPEADRRTLIRRLYFDLIGLPPAPDEVDAFVKGSDPKAYEKLVDRLLASKHYGERWARHWLDVVHYGDTHGYDKDKLRPNAWPYRDYVIRAFNNDKPYQRFVLEQLAGDVLYPNTTDGIVATGFIAAGPWDYVGHAEVPESKIDGKIARLLDRDDMVSATMNTFVSMTVQCARCHNHKFDPVTQEDYYSLHAVFAAVDRADRPFEVSPEIAQQRVKLGEQRKKLAADKVALAAEIKKLAGPKLAELDVKIAALGQQAKMAPSAAFGYHSAIVAADDKAKWVQVDLRKSVAVEYIIIVGCNDSFAGIGAGFGFPVRYKVEISDDPAFKKGVVVVEDRTKADVPNPGVKPRSIAAGGKQARYVRVTATKLAERKNDYIFALAELSVLVPGGGNAARGVKVTSLDSIQAPIRWQRKNLVDGYYFGRTKGDALPQVATLSDERRKMIDAVMTDALRKRSGDLDAAIKTADRQLAELPGKGMVYAGKVHKGSGHFRGRAGMGPREIRILARGDVRNPGALAVSGTVPIISGVAARFQLAKDHKEGDRRAALARWIVDRRNPLTWRSIVNRVWLYHTGRGIVDSPNDLGRMGQLPSHPELLDWLAVEFRDGGQSLKKLHRLIVTSSFYRQSSNSRTAAAKIDGGNQYLWRMNRRRLDAESIRDTVLLVAGKFDKKMYGPGFRDFVLEHPEHSPHYEYQKHDPDDPKSHRRSIYRFLVRSQQQPFMQVLDCADPSQLVDKRGETLTPLGALALLNNRFMTRMAEHFAARLAREHDGLDAQIEAGCRLALARRITADEKAQLVAYAKQHGLANTTRVILNLNEFLFVD
jgi:hypothetical protein